MKERDLSLIAIGAVIVLVTLVVVLAVQLREPPSYHSEQWGNSDHLWWEPFESMWFDQEIRDGLVVTCIAITPIPGYASAYGEAVSENEGLGLSCDWANPRKHAGAGQG